MVETKQIKGEVGKIVKPNVILEIIMDAWNVIVSFSFVIQFRRVHVVYYEFLKYIESAILNYMQENIVGAWTDQVTHFGNNTTNIVEYAHVTLNNWLGNNKRDLCKGWDSMNQMIKNQHNEIQTSFGCNINVLQHRFKYKNLYSQLVDNICGVGLSFIYHKIVRA